MEPLKELDIVVLTRNIEEHLLREGDVGTVVHLYADNLASEVEFVTGNGKTIAVITLEEGDYRPIGDRDILHARELAA